MPLAAVEEAEGGPFSANPWFRTRLLGLLDEFII